MILRFKSGMPEKSFITHLKADKKQKQKIQKAFKSTKSSQKLVTLPQKLH
jgi:hypothetical protein